MLVESENFLKIFLRAVLFRRFAPSFCSVVLRAALVQICRFTVPFCPLFLARRFAPPLCPAVLLRRLPAAGLKQKRAGENAGGIDSAARVFYNRCVKP